MTNTTRRHVLAASLLALAGVAHAQDSGAIKMIVAFGPGTTTDTVSHVVAEALGKQLNQPVIVDNRAGAGGSVGSDQVAKSAPDGKALVMGTVGTHAINAALFRKLPYDTLRDFAPVAFIGSTPTLLVVAANALGQPDVATRLRDQGIEQRVMRTEEMLPFNKAELVKWAELVKRSGAQVD